ncbi:MAG: DEAD/DEAH box helicase [bacterium]|nr:DEAD/DEAH box helicase [bacterium]
MATTAAIDRLDERVQRWIWSQGWKGLRPVQEAVVDPILAGDRDLIVSAATAAGKTEAAFLPIASQLVRTPAEGVQALYLSPLKALINDQHRRLDEIAAGLDVPVHRWHGDVASAAKERVTRDPRGVLLITPESLEAMFVLRASRLPGIFAPLAYVVIDEMHAFLGSERGRQLQSLLTRIEDLLERRIPRVGLSATLGDMSIAAEFLRPDDPGGVQLVVDDGGDSEVKIGLRGYSDQIEDAELAHDPTRATSGEVAIADDLLRFLRGSSNLVFANSRRDVEVFAARLFEACEERRVPNEFFPHHGSLAKLLREEAEARLKDGKLPTNVICTSTLEMGIDVGDVASVCQLGAPPSVAALRQRLGRSGRRGTPSILRVLVREPALGEKSAPQDRLREELVQAIAAIELLLEGWCEPLVSGAPHLSTLIQQILSVVAERSGANARELHDLLCVRGPFDAVDAEDFAELLRAMGQAELISQDSRGTLLSGPVGERIVEHYSFYAAFQSTEEYRVVADGRTLGTMPVTSALTPDGGLVFAGRSWRIEEIDEQKGVITVRPGFGGDPPVFRSSFGRVAGEVRERMRHVLETDAVPAFLDGRAAALLAQAREAFAELRLSETSVVEHKRDSILFAWAGDRVLGTIRLELIGRGVETSHDGLALCARRTSADELWAHLGDLEYEGFSDPEDLARRVRAKAREKYDPYLSDDLLTRAFAATHIDVAGAERTLERILVHR